MELRTFWTEQAIFQLEDIFDYYKHTAGLNVSRKISKKIVERTIQLEKHPDSGQKEELLNHRTKEFRYIVEGNYKIIYWIEKPHIKIASIFDCRQNPNKVEKI